MKQIWLRKVGGPDVLEVEENQAALRIREHDVHIDVHYSGINFADVIMRLGLYRDAPRRPFVPGYEISGVVRRVGKSVSKLQPGDPVFAGTLFGGYSSEVVVPEDLVFKLPAHLSLSEAAGLPVNWITAHAALIDMGRVRAGDRVLVDSASGGVGTLALQILKWAGADTLGLTSSPAKLDFIRSLGARAMTHEEYQKRKAEMVFDLILNSQGGRSVREHYDRLSPTGRVIAFGMSSAIREGKRDILRLLKMAVTMPKFSLIKMFDENRGVYALNVLKLLENSEYRTSLGKKSEFVERAQLKPHIDRIFKAEDVSSAHSLLESRGARGKVIITWIG